MSYNATHKRRVSHKPNRLLSETQNTWAVPTKVAGILAFLAVVLIAYVALRHSTDALWRDIGEAEQKQEALEQDLAREAREWDLMRSQRNLIVALRNNGITMTATPHGRRIAMGGAVRPARGGATAAPTALAANL